MNHVIYIESMSSSDSSDAESNKGDDGCGLLSADESSDVDGTSIESDDYQCIICGNSGGRWIVMPVINTIA